MYYTTYLGRPTANRPNEVALPPTHIISDEDRASSNYITNYLKKHGLCLYKDFLNVEDAELIYKEVNQIYKTSNTFKEGETLVQGKNKIRKDVILWVGKDYSECKTVKLLCDKLDKLISICSAQLNGIHIQSRTRGMVACYPGNGTYYKKHVDNPLSDGRIITALYYLNKDWNKHTDGGLLRIYPKQKPNSRVDFSPIFNTLLIFFSDGRNPHEVLPAYRERFAITHWYFDHKEREDFHERIKHGVSKSGEKSWKR